MSVAARAAMLTIPLLSIILTAIAGYAYSQVVSLYLPIPRALGLLTILLPLITGSSARLTQNLILRAPKSEQNQLTIPVLFIIGFQLVYETIIVTLALTNIIPPGSLNCGLQDQWMAMFRAKNENAIRGIQDRFECCGLMTTKDKAWPFPDKKHTVSPCEETFGRTKSCLGEWRQAQQVNAGLFLLVAIVVFIVKLVVILFLITGSSWSMDRSWIRSLRYRNGVRRDDVNGRRVSRRLIDGGESSADGGEVEVYRDDVEGPDRGQESGPRVQPSALGAAEGDNIWRERESASAPGVA